MAYSLLVEASIVGIATIVVGIIIYFLGTVLFPTANLNSIYAHIIMFFILGFSIHIIAEFTKVNGWYCDNGYACRS